MTPRAASLDCQTGLRNGARRSVRFALRLRETASGLLALSAILVIVALARADAEWKLLEEHWYVLEIGEQPAGRMRSVLYERDDRYRSDSEMTLEMARGAVGTTIEIKSSFIETHDGRPISMSTRQVMSQQPVESVYEFREDGVTETTRHGGREMTREHALPDGIWLTPRAAHRFVLERMRAGADEITYRSIDPVSGIKPTRVTSRRSGEDTYTFENREIPVTIWRTVSEETAPLEAIVHYTSDGQIVYHRMPTGLGQVVMRRVSRQEAMATQGTGAPDLFTRTLVQTDQPIRDVMKARTLRMRLKARAGELPQLPSTGAQRVTMSEDRMSAVLEVDLDEPVPATDDERADAEYLAPSPVVDSDDALVVALARRALRSLDSGEHSDPAKRAESLRAFVFDYLSSKNLDTAFASASETARTRTGDCTEHAVLLAALLRASGIPSRAASGLVYIDRFAGHQNVFGWHMWTQALIDEKWVDLDATLPVTYHAGHITTSVSSLADRGSSENGSMMTLIGNVDVEVIDQSRRPQRSRGREPARAND